MSPHDDRFLELLPAHALGALDGEELAAVESHVASGCDICERELAAWHGEVERLAAATVPVAPSDTTRARVLARAAADAAPVATAPRRATTALRLALAAALGALVVGGWLHLDLRRQVAELGAERRAAADRLARLEAEIDATRSELAGLRHIGGIAASPQTRLVALADLTEPGAAFGQALVDPIGRRAVFYAYGLRPTEEGKTYQLWYISAGTPVSAGIFEVDAEGRAMVLVEEVAPAETIDAWAVTVEPAGGVPQPTGPMVLKG
jgi:anti-sigma-K factor RskA